MAEGRQVANESMPKKAPLVPVTDIFPNHGHLPIRIRVTQAGVRLWHILHRHRKELPATLFIDESGDAELFNKKKQVIVGQNSSRFFMMGLAWVIEPASLGADLEALRKEILQDPYLKRVPSVHEKTAKMFHAKDDCPEVRMQVFRLLSRHPIQFFAFVRDKLSVVDWVRRLNAADPAFRYTTNTLYDSMVPSILEHRLHRDSAYTIYFAKRRISDRTEALNNAVLNARARFLKKWGIAGEGPVVVRPRYPWDPDAICLQAADYILWAVQRLFERNDDRYIDYVWPSVRLIWDFDDVGKTPYGVYYTQGKKPDVDCMKARKRR